MSLFDDASLVLTPNGYKASKLYSIKPTSGLGDMTVVRATTATRVNSSNVIESVAINVPRLDYTLDSCPKILLEPARTNLLLYSEQFNNAIWAKTGVTVTANTTTAPDGTTTADLIEPTISDAKINQGFNPTGALQHNFSVYLRSATGSSFSTVLRITRDSPFSNVANTVITVTTEWQRFNLSFTALDSTIHQATIGGGSTLSIGENLYAWGAQCELGAYATSYIPTTTGTVTRNADVITRNNVYTNNLITSSGGTWFIEFRNNIARTRDGAMTGLILDTSSSSFTNGFNIRNTGGTSRLNISKWQGGSGASLYTTTTDTTKIAIKWNGATADIFANGVKVVSATAFTPTAMQFLNANALIGIPYNIKQMALFPTPLTDTQCTQLTTL